MSDKKHPATAKKLREARKRGELARSKELTSFAAYLAVSLALWLATTLFLRHAIAILDRGIEAAAPSRLISADFWLPKVQSMLTDAVWILLPLLGVGVAGACLVGLIQTRGAFSVHPITPKFERINPAEGLKNLFSLRQLVELGKMLLKMALLLSALGYLTIVSMDALVSAIYAPVADLLQIGGRHAMRLMGWAAAIYAVSAVVDYGHQRFEFMKRQRMTVEELRREHREEMGDPAIRASRRAVARSAAYAGLADRVASSNLVIANPTHVCVALYYLPGETPLPRVVAKGVDAVALRIRAAAETAGVPVLEDPALARRVFSEVALDDYIDDQLIEVIAAAFRWARRMDRRTSHSGSSSPR